MAAKANDPWNALRENPVVRLVTDSFKSAVPLSGYLLKGPEGGFWRLYRTLAFDEYIEFAENDSIIFVYQVAEDQQTAGNPDALEPAVIWFSTDTQVDRVQTFLVGELASAYLPQAHLATGLGEAGQKQAVLAASVGGCTTKPNCGCFDQPKP